MKLSDISTVPKVFRKEREHPRDHFAGQVFPTKVFPYGWASKSTKGRMTDDITSTLKQIRAARAQSLTKTQKLS